MLARLLLVASCALATGRPASKLARSHVARAPRPSAAPPLHLRGGGGALATPFTPLELAEAAAGLMYTTQILLMPKRWVAATLWLEATPDALALVGLLGAILANARLGLAYLRIRQTAAQQREIDVLSAAGWGACAAWTLWFKQCQTGGGFLANIAINSAFAAAFAIRAIAAPSPPDDDCRRQR